jgi:transcriptional pleiotropic regulator of transition state genes
VKSTGMTRPVDQLGRVVIPKEVRKTLDIQEDRDRLEIFVDEENIILRKYKRGCIICGETEGLKKVWDKDICLGCINEITHKAGDGS